MPARPRRCGAERARRFSTGRCATVCTCVSRTGRSSTSRRSSRRVTCSSARKLRGTRSSTTSPSTTSTPGPEAAVQELLRAWFQANGRDLPWRRTTDPYAILVSEVMLQQTQVERVIPRWERWLSLWPTVEALAGATPAEAIVEWQGLGYNRRAVNLHPAAPVGAELGWPGDLTDPPGVGPYTAAAVGNFALGRAVLPVDMNVERVQARTGHSFDHTCAQALFDLGATVCLARIPRCGECPLADACPSRGNRYEPLRK